MEIGNNGAGLRQIRTLFSVGVVRDLTDGQLLERFASARGDSAELTFAEIVERHGPMVLRVCRGVLDDPHDANDAFQATFLVLMKKARTLWVRDSLGPWLHQVAYRTARCARSASARRRRLERAAASAPREPSRTPDDELALGLHEELARLPERFRAPLVLCDLEGRTHEQAARHLGWPVGTVKSRQARGRDRLRDRLTRRGLSPRPALLAPALLPELALPQPLIDSTTAAVLQFATARTLTAGPAATLALGVLRTMSIARWFKTASALTLGVTLTGVAALGQRPGPGNAPPSTPAAPAKPALPDRKSVFHSEGRGSSAGLPGHSSSGHSVSYLGTGPAPGSLTVVPGKLSVGLSAHGSVGLPESMVVASRIQWSTPLASILPEGTKVVKDQVVAELKPVELQPAINEQKNASRRIENLLDEAREAENAARLALEEYRQGISRAEEAKARSAIVEAETSLASTESRIARTERAREALRSLAKIEGTKLTSADIMTLLEVENRIDNDRQSIQRSKSAIQLAESQITQLDITRQKTISQLKIAVIRLEKPRIEKEIAMEQQIQAEADLEAQVKSCTLRAPNDGVVGYADPSEGVSIRQGTEIKPTQKIFSVLDTGRPLIINAWVLDVDARRVSTGHKVRIKVDAFPNESLSGVVESIAPRPSGDKNSPVKFYATTIRLDTPHPGLRPGMNAGSNIFVAELENVLSVPLGMVAMSGSNYYIDVKRADGTVEQRDLKLGASDGTNIEVKEGLKAGDVVVAPRLPYKPPVANP